MSKKPKEERTADIRTIFMKTTEYVHPDTGKKLAGHYCVVCRYVFIPSFDTFGNILLRHKGQKPYFFSGGVSSLRTHIARYGGLLIITLIISNCLKGTRITSMSTKTSVQN